MPTMALSALLQLVHLQRDRNQILPTPEDCETSQEWNHSRNRASPLQRSGCLSGLVIGSWNLATGVDNGSDRKSNNQS